MNRHALDGGCWFDPNDVLQAIKENDELLENAIAEIEAGTGPDTLFGLYEALGKQKPVW
jgi:hypothetical protein